MNHNFANWEITQLLPEINPYINTINKQYLYIGTKEFKYVKLITNSKKTRKCKRVWLRDAWSWEDIRLYLLSKGYVYDITYKVDSIDEYNHQILWYFNVLSTLRLEHDEDFTYYSTYEECREAAILFILNDNGWNR